MNTDRTKDLISLALAQYDSGAFEESIVHLSKALELDPGNPGALSLRALANYALNFHVRALADYSAVIKLQPENAHAFNGRGLALAAVHLYKDALRDFDTAIRLDPDFADPRYNKQELERWLREDAGEFNQDPV